MTLWSAHVTVEDAVRLPFPDGTFDFARRAATFGALAVAASARDERLGGITRDASERSSLDGSNHRGNVRFAKDVSDAVEDEPGKAAVLRPRRNDPCISIARDLELVEHRLVLSCKIS